MKRIKDSVSYDSILESISDGVFTVDKDWRITSFNRAAEEITGIGREEAIGSICSDVFRSSMCENACALRKTLSSGEPIIDKTCYIINSSGEKIPVSISTAVLKNSDGKVCGGAETFRDLREIQSLRQQINQKYKIGDLVSRSTSMQEIFRLLPVISPSSSTVLIEGETGTGKELLARAVHSLSGRKDKPLVALNCAALPDTLLESELFGYKKGAFTGAESDKPGYFAVADKGSLFLDEIADISPALQVKLLRVLQEKSYLPLGASNPEFSDVRLIAATNKRLAEEVEKGNFRQDLFYRLNVIKLELPPLRERKEDIPLLVEHFINKFNHLQNRQILGFSTQAMAALMAHDWPGNIRELENVVERSFVICSGDEIEIEQLPDNLRKEKGNLTENFLKINQLQNEKQIIQAALEANHFNRNAAARSLGIHKTSLYRKIKRYGIQLPASGKKPPLR